MFTRKLNILDILGNQWFTDDKTFGGGAEKKQIIFNLFTVCKEKKDFFFTYFYPLMDKYYAKNHSN